MSALRELARRLSGYDAARTWQLARRLQRWDVVDESRKAFYSQFLAPGDLCFDVGANLGNRSKVFLKLGARVVAAEPLAACADVLHKAFSSRPEFELVRAALGAEPGEAEIRIPKETTIASMSTEWIAAVKESGRFSEFQWDRVERVPVTTLDALIHTHGTPAFVKVDVEGFEEQVVRGLSVQVGAMSLEFTPERLASTLTALRHLESLGAEQFNFALGEEMALQMQDWSTLEGFVREMESRHLGTQDFGDVYVRFP